jgi:hypothetical protein
LAREVPVETDWLIVLDPGVRSGPSNKILIYTRQDNGIAVVPVHSKSVKRLKSDNYRFQACDLSWISNTAGFEPDAHWCL